MKARGRTRARPGRFELRGKGVLLKPVTLRDADALYEHVKDREIARYTLGIPHPYPREAMTTFLRQSIRERRGGQRHLFAIRRYDSDEPIGLIDLLNIRLGLRSAEIGFWLGRTFWNQGIMTQALKLMLGFAFDTLHLHRVLVRHVVGNDASRRVIEKCWFRREGVDRELAFIDRKWLDVIRYGLLEQEYRAIGSGTALAPGRGAN